MKENDEIEAIFWKRNQQALSEKEQKTLDAWLASNKDVLNDYEDQKSTVAILESDDQLLKKYPYKDFKNKLLLKTKKATGNLLKKIAVILILVSIGGFGAWEMSQTKTTIVSAGDFIKKHTLPDGSVIQMNKNSKLVYNKSFDKKNRTISLEGEAFFKVAHNPKLPFKVVLKNESSLNVLGTEFNVTSDNAKNSSRTYLSSGSLLWKAKNGKSLLLKPGDHFEYDNKTNEWTVSEIETNQLMSWRRSSLDFKDLSFTEICQSLSSYFETPIKIKNKNLIDKRFTARFHHLTPLDTILDLLSDSYDFKFHKTPNTWIIE